MGIWLFHIHGWTGPRLTLPSLRALRRTPLVRADAEALLFSAKTFAAAMLAYYIALRIGLARPSWAIVTAYLVAQSSAGASLSRGLYRLFGTLAGAAATVAIIPTFVGEPLVCSLVLACWIGFCLFLSLLDRTPRAYAFVLAGYTASLIGFPGVAAPGAIFETALVRVQEIVLGILCTVLVHRVVLPRPISGPFVEKINATLRDARRLASDALKNVADRQRQAEGHRLAVDLLALNGLATHLPYDPAGAAPNGRTLRHLHDRLARLLPLATEIEARLAAMGDRRGLAYLLGDVARWIDTAPGADRDEEARRLIDNAQQIQVAAQAEPARAENLLRGNLAGRLAELVALLHDCDMLGREVAARGSLGYPSALRWPMRATGYLRHRDPLMAARAAAGATIGIFTGCLFWIWSAWPDGGLAVSVLGVACALFGNVDAPAPNLRKYLLGSFYGVAISLAYSFAILPRVTDFPTLVAVLAPALLLGGSLQARPPTAFKALGITLTIPILTGLSVRYAGDFADALNSGIALFGGLSFGVVSMALLQTVPPETAIDRLLRLSRRDVARRPRGRGPAEAGWTSLMVDRIALLVPRLALSGRARTDTLDEMLRHLRIGHAAAALHRVVSDGAGPPHAEARQMLAMLARAFSNGQPAAAAIEALDAQIGMLMTHAASEPDSGGLALLDPLLDLRYALQPVAATHAADAA